MIFNAADGFLGLRPGIYATGGGKAAFRDLRYRALTGYRTAFAPQHRSLRRVATGTGANGLARVGQRGVRGLGTCTRVSARCTTGVICA